MDNLQLKLFRLGAKLVAPQSISASERTFEDGYFPDEYLQFVDRRRCVRAGDLILIHTPGRAYSAMRKIAGQGDYDHLGVVTEGGMFLHVGPPKVRLIPVEMVLDPVRRPIVYRPALTRSERNKFCADARQLLGAKYDTKRVLGLIRRLSARNYFQVESSSRLSSTPDRYICTDALMTRLLENCAALRHVVNANNAELFGNLDYQRFGAFTLRDVVHIHHTYPDLLQTVALPIVPLNHGDEKGMTGASSSSSPSSSFSQSLFARAKRLRHSQWVQMKHSFKYFARLDPVRRKEITKLYFRKAYLYARPASFVFVHAFLHMHRSKIPFSGIFLKYGTILTLYLMSQSIVASRKELRVIEETEKARLGDSNFNPRKLTSAQISFPATVSLRSKL